MKALLLSGYDAASHRRWYTHLIDKVDFIDWTVLQLPPRHFFWRIRSNALTWASKKRETLEANYDLVLATSMVDLASLKGFIPNLSDIPSIVYFHENQFAYPTPPHREAKIHPKMTNLFSAFAADCIAFNSEYNRDSCLAGIDDFVEQAPDGLPADLSKQLREKSDIIPVPLENECFEGGGGTNPRSGKVKIVWNHRWEYDKGPDRLEALLSELDRRDADFEIHIAGQQFSQWPDAFDRIKQRHDRSIATFGYIEQKSNYVELLRRADVVLSTSMHEFQGLAVLEAIAHGCHPLVPDRLAYRDYLSDKWRYDSFENDIEAEAKAAVDQLVCWCQKPQLVRKQAAPDVRSFSWDHLGPKYRRLLKQMGDGTDGK